jgi:type IV pilus assembly protein PilX
MKKNAGFVLVSGMVFLLVITIIVIYLLRTSILEEKMVANSIDRQRAVQAADAVLREAESLVLAGGPPFDPFVLESFSSTCVSGLCKNQSKTTSPWTSISWSTVANLKVSSLSFYKVASPYYVIEVVAPPSWTAAEGCGVVVYRIVAKGVGSIGAQTLVQSYFRTRPSKCPN